MADRCNICDETEEGPFKELYVTVESPALATWLEGKEKVWTRVFICWGCWNGTLSEREQASLITLGALNAQLQTNQRLAGRAVQSLARWL